MNNLELLQKINSLNEEIDDINFEIQKLGTVDVVKDQEKYSKSVNLINKQI